MRTKVRRLTTVALTAVTAGALVATAAPASAIPSGTHGFHTAKSGLSGVHGWGTFKPGRYNGEKTAVVYAKIKDTSAKDHRLAALEVQFSDADGNYETQVLWNTKNILGRVAQGGVQSYYLYGLKIRECKGYQYRNSKKKLRFHATKCGSWRVYYQGTRIVG